MSIFGAMYSGISGLNTNSLAMSIIGDNIANINTVGYKRSRATFQDLMAYPVIGVGTESFVGRGAMLQNVDQEMSQGSFLSTGNGLDLAIHGNGFFIMSGAMGGQTTNFYTRSGQFHVDMDGYMVGTNSMRLQGYSADAAGNISTLLGDLQFKDIGSPAKATENLELHVNLNSEGAVTGPFNLADVEGTSNFNTTITIYDSLGAAHDVTVYFSKTATGQWGWNAVVDAADAAGGVTEIQASGTLSFTSEGKLDTVAITDNAFDFAGGATANQAVDFDFGDSITTHGGTGLAGSTQFASESTVTFQSQDGFPPGDLQTVVIDDDGTITGTFTNGQRRTMGQIALADFRGTGLRRMGSNLWQATTESGDPLVGTANSGTRGGIASSVLEQANVDLASEFVSMISAQRGFQANSRTIVTADQLLQETLNIKR